MTTKQQQLLQAYNALQQHNLKHSKSCSKLVTVHGIELMHAPTPEREWMRLNRAVQELAQQLGLHETAKTGVPFYLSESAGEFLLSYEYGSRYNIANNQLGSWEVFSVERSRCGFESRTFRHDGSVDGLWEGYFYWVVTPEMKFF